MALPHGQGWRDDCRWQHGEDNRSRGWQGWRNDCVLQQGRITAVAGGRVGVTTVDGVAKGARVGVITAVAGGTTEAVVRDRTTAAPQARPQASRLKLAHRSRGQKPALRSTHRSRGQELACCGGARFSTPREADRCMTLIISETCLSTRTLRNTALRCCLCENSVKRGGRA